MRDPRLDFFRGIAMFVIFVAHVPSDWWALWIPARFGFSDATETFVFCSGMASALAFASVFDRHGWTMGVARVGHRVWQVYWSHIALFLAVLLLVLALSQAVPKNYAIALNLGHFLDKTAITLPGLMTLTYVPNYFDILPMYLVILALIPVVMGLSRLSPWAVAAFCLTLYVFANPWLVGLREAVPSPGPAREYWSLFGTVFTSDLPAEPWSNRAWFFNPFGWQLVFFTGFALMRGWIPAPPVKGWLVALAAVFVVVCVPYAWSPWNSVVPFLQDFAASNRDTAALVQPFAEKTDFGPLRYVHFLATAYLAWVAVGPMGARLSDWGRLTVVVDVIRKVGQQSLAVFLASLFLAQFAGFVLDQWGRSWTTTGIVTLAGFAALIAVAYAVAWFKTQPWRNKPSQTKVVQRADMAGTMTAAEPAE